MLNVSTCVEDCLNRMVSNTHIACFNYFILQSCTPRAHNTKLIQVITIASSAAIWNKLDTLRLDTTEQVVSCRAKYVEFVL